MLVRVQQWLALAALVMAFSASHGQNSWAWSTRPASAARASPARTYKLYCSRCHGTKGQGGAGANLQGLSDSPAEIAATITQGQGKMPPFRRLLTARQIQRLAVHVKGFSQ